MKILIIEDEAPAFRRLQKLLEEINPEINIIDVLDSVQESITWFKTQKKLPDLIFMDIQLSDGLSFEIFDSIKINRPVIFTTAFDEYTLRAFKVNSIDYLLKPIKKENLAASLNKYYQMKKLFGSPLDLPDLNAIISQISLNDKKYKTRFLVKKGEELTSIETSKVAYFHTRNGVVHMATINGQNHIMDFNLDELVQQLDLEKFYRANRQFIIHFSAISKVHKYYKGKLLVEMNQPTEEPITVSSEKASHFKTWLGN